MIYILALIFIGLRLDPNNPHNTGVVPSNRFIYWAIVTAFVVTPIQQWHYVFFLVFLPEVIYLTCNSQRA